MGEIADMMLDGTLCEGCGEYLGEGDGFPNYCSDECARDRGMTLINGTPVPLHPPATKQRGQRPKCPTCGKKCKSADGVKQHMRDKHGEANA